MPCLQRSPVSLWPPKVRTHLYFVYPSILCGFVFWFFHFCLVNLCMFLTHERPTVTTLLEVTLEEFIDGIMRCKGPARAIDQAGANCAAMLCQCWFFPSSQPKKFESVAVRWRSKGMLASWITRRNIFVSIWEMSDWDPTSWASGDKGFEMDIQSLQARVQRGVMRMGIWTLDFGHGAERTLAGRTADFC